MKTLKYLAYVLAAAATLSFVGCVKDSTDCPVGEDLDGEQIYISNTTTTFYVRTAEEKQTKAAELAKYGHGITVSPSATATDDKQISLPIFRKNGIDAFQGTYTVSLPTANVDLFTLPKGSVKKAETVVIDGVEYTQNTVPFAFAELEDETSIVIGFDITKLKGNVSYPFIAELDQQEQGSYYGANKFSFKIYHSVAVHEPWVEIGKIDFKENWYYDLDPYEIAICIHEHDFTDDSFVEIGGEKVINPDPTKRTLKKQAYYRFCIPYYMYQCATASVALGDGVFSEGDLPYFENCDGIIFQLDANYDFVWDYSAKNYASPLAEDITTGAKTQYLRGAWAYVHSTGSASSIIWDGYATFNSGLKAGWYFYTSTSYSNGTHSANNYDLMLMLIDVDSASLYGATCDFLWTWKTNSLVADWDNFFKVDYNNLAYEGIASGTFTSEMLPEASGERSLFKAVDGLYKNEVYYIYNPYGTATQTQNIGIAVLLKDGTASVAKMLPSGLSILGKPVYMKQNEDNASTIEHSASGNISKITANIDFVFEDGNCVGTYSEVFTTTADNTVDAFVGTFDMAAYKIWYPYSTSGPKLSKLSSTVTITKIDDFNVTIDGLIDDWYAGEYFAGQKFTVSGIFDPETNQIRIPAQYFMNGNDATSCEYGFAYFQPGETSYGAYNFSTGAYFISELAATATECALRLDTTGVIWLENSLSEPTGAYADGFSVDLYVANKAGDGFESDGSLYTTFAYGYYFLTLTPQTPAPTAAKASLPVKKSEPQLTAKQLSTTPSNKKCVRK